MALIFVPTIGALIGKPEASDPDTMRCCRPPRTATSTSCAACTGLYVRALRRRLLRRPGGSCSWRARDRARLVHRLRPRSAAACVLPRGRARASRTFRSTLGAICPRASATASCARSRTAHSGGRRIEDGLRSQRRPLPGRGHRRGRDRDHPARVQGLACAPAGARDPGRDPRAHRDLAGIWVEDARGGGRAAGRQAGRSSRLTAATRSSSSRGRARSAASSIGWTG